MFVTCVYVFFLFRVAVRAFSLACPADYCNALHILSFLANKRERERERELFPLHYVFTVVTASQLA